MIRIGLFNLFKNNVVFYVPLLFITSVSGGIETRRWGNIVFRQSYSLICVRHVLSSLFILQNMLQVMSVMSHVMCVMTQVMSCMPCHMTHNMYNVCIICLIVIRIIRKQLMIVSNMLLACHIMSCHMSCDITCHVMSHVMSYLM